MEIRVDLDEMRKRSIFVATPMYGGQCTGMYTKSIADLTAKCVQNGIGIKSFFLFNESLIQRARNYAVDEFMRSDCTHLMFIDADIGFNPDDVLAMLALMGPTDQYDVLCGPYPKKVISWEKIKRAVDKGIADQNPNILERFVGDYVFNLKAEPGQAVNIQLDQPTQIAEGGTGFMMIKRETLDRYAAAYPGQFYLPDHVRSEHFDGKREIVAFFDCEIDPQSRRYLSEDYMFCRNVWNAGMSVWLCPWMQLSHTGTYQFGGSLADLAAVGADPTAVEVAQRK